MDNLLSVDLEEWFHLGFYKVKEDEKKSVSPEPLIVKDTLKLLRAFKKFGAKATFFVLGATAQDYPDLVKEIEKDGHEIASHGFKHAPIRALNPLQFEDDLKRSQDLLSKITRQRIIGYRAPHLSIGQCRWAYELLAKNGFLYDSSVKHRPKLPSRKCSQYYAIDLPQQGLILEFPLSVVFDPFLPIAFSGGSYFRLLPKSVLKRFIKNINSKGPAHIYLHPRDIADYLPRLKLSFLNQLRYRGHLGNTFNKLNYLLNNFKFSTIKQCLKNDGYWRE